MTRRLPALSRAVFLFLLLLAVPVAAIAFASRGDGAPLLARASR